MTLYHQNNTAYLIIDGDAQDEAMASLSPQMMMRPPTWVCETVAELETEIGLAPGSLQATVTAYNEGASRGEDPLLHKKPEWLKPIRSPIGAIDLRESTGGFTLGGLQTTLDSEVLHVNGEPIPGLFAAGRSTAGLAAWGYASGISLGDGSFYGRRAGRRPPRPDLDHRACLSAGPHRACVGRRLSRLLPLCDSCHTTMVQTGI